MKLSKKIKKYNLHNILSIQTNLAGIISNYFAGPNQAKLKLKVIVKNKLSIDYLDIVEFGPGLLYSESQDTIISHIKLFGKSFIIKVKGLTKDDTKVYLNKNYYLFNKLIVRIPISTMFPLDHFIKLIIHLKLLLNNYSYLISGGLFFNNKDFGFLTTSMGGMGKTTTIKTLIKKYKSTLLSDDTVIISKDKVYSYPMFIRNRITKNVFLSYDKFEDSNDIYKNKIESSLTKIKYIFFLERANHEKTIQINQEQALSKLSSINRKIIPLEIERLIIALSYVSPKFDPFRLIEKERQIIQEFLKDKKIMILRAKFGDKQYYSKVISKMVGEEN